MTRAQIIAELDGMIGPGNPLDGSVKIMFVNDAYMYMVDCLLAANPDYFTKASTTIPLAGQQQYDLPADFEKAIMVNIKQNGVWQRCKPLPNITDVAVISNTDGSNGFSAGAPVYYIVGSQIGFEPIPTDSAGEIKLWYAYSVGELDEDNDVPALPPAYHHVLKYGAYANFLDQDDQHGAADNMRNRFQQRIDKMIETMFENQAEEGKSIQISQGQELYIDDN